VREEEERRRREEEEEEAARRNADAMLDLFAPPPRAGPYADVC
jgi:hypothetical protein